jgi:hypothetical protein
MSLQLTRAQILAFRRRTNFLGERLPGGKKSLERAAWAGLQDSMPRAALLSLHARVAAIRPDVLDDPALAQLWGPRFNTYVVAKRDFALFSLGRLPDDAKGRDRAERLAAEAHARLGGKRVPDRNLGLSNAIRYAGATGTLAIRWEGARAPLVWSVPRPKISPENARRELARRYLHIFGPTTDTSFARWAGIGRGEAARAFAALDLIAVRGGTWLLAEDEDEMRSGAAPEAPARLLPSGDAYWLLDGAEREVLVPQADRRAQLWTPRVWPGALLVDGEIRGTWRRAQHKVQIDTWGRLPAAARKAVEEEAVNLPLPGLEGTIHVIWNA